MLRTQEERQAEAWKQAIDAATELQLQPKDPVLLANPYTFDEHSTGWTLSQGLAKGAMLSLQEHGIDVMAAAFLEKARDGAVRSGWTMRFFVLTSDTLYYHRRNDSRRELTGEERGKISVHNLKRVEHWEDLQGTFK